MFDLKKHVDAIHDIHSKQNRKWDKDVPYWTHPLWCATMILSEKNLGKAERHRGALALLYHDAREIGWGERVPEEVNALVKEMTFTGFDEEMIKLWGRSREARMLKLYDKVSNLVDGHWMGDKRKEEYHRHTRRLAYDVQENFGKLKIVELARIYTKNPNSSIDVWID